jgi:hypothetical protein
MGAANVVKYYDYARIRQLLVFLSGHSAEFYIQKFPVAHKKIKVIDTKVI